MKKVTRHQERIWAVQILYSLDIKDVFSKKQCKIEIENLLDNNDLKDDDYYFKELVYGVLDNIENIDQKISKQAVDWELSRMAYVDRNILRIAIFEMESDIPVGVAINEAVELAKEFADEKSSSFINGILGELNRL